MVRMLALIIIGFIAISCSNPQLQRNKLLSDITLQKEAIKGNNVIHVEEVDVKNAYESYLKSPANINHKKKALQRLAELELLNEAENIKFFDDNDALNSSTNNSSSIKTLKRHLAEFPNDKNNDKIYYLLARAYSLRGLTDNKVKTLEHLIDNYHNSPYYIESLFRLGEEYLTKSRYHDAELVLTSVIVEDKTKKYHKNAIFKRAWALYKQLRYDEAINDYNLIIHQYIKKNTVNAADQEFNKSVYKVYTICLSYLDHEKALEKMELQIKERHIVYKIYSNFGAMLIKQSRYSDLERVYYRYLSLQGVVYKDKILAELINAWHEYDNKEYAIAKLEEIDIKYSNDVQIQKDVFRENAGYLAQYYHALSQINHNKENYKKAYHWYSTLLIRYPSNVNARQHYYFAELLYENKQYQKSFEQYKKILTNYHDYNSMGDVAFAILQVSDKLYLNKAMESKAYNNEYMAFINKYKAHKQYNKVLVTYLTYLYNKQSYHEYINIYEKNGIDKKNDYISYLLAGAYLETSKYNKAEQIYRELANKKLFTKYKELKRRYAISIYKQAEKYATLNNYPEAITKYKSIEHKSPYDEIVIAAKIDIAGIYLRKSQWVNAIKELSDIRKKYKKNNYEYDITKKMAISYLNNYQDFYAAQEFDRLSYMSVNDEEKKASLWQSAELYESAGSYQSAIDAYKRYTRIKDLPVAQYVETAYRLSQLYKTVKDTQKELYWWNKIIYTHAHTKNISRTERIKYLMALASIAIAKNKYYQYKSIKLTMPIDKSLNDKKSALKSTIDTLKNVVTTKYNDEVTESIYLMAELYYEFSKALLESDRPGGLNDDELEQYDILLEDQAIPFEDNAIRYYVQNTVYAKDGLFNDWVGRSYQRLSDIFPSKYKRSESTDHLINTFN